MTDVLHTPEVVEPLPDGMIGVENPATGEQIAVVPDMSTERVKAVVARARAAQPAWEALGFAERARLMYA